MSWWEKKIKFTTISGDAAVMNEPGAQYNSFCAYKSLFKLSDSSGELYTTSLNHGEVYNINQSSLMQFYISFVKYYMILNIINDFVGCGGCSIPTI